MKTGSLYIIAITAVIIAIAALPALADYHYASHTGSNEYPYTSWATAADSIQKAIDAATAGDTIYVGAGVWSERDSLDFYKALIGRGIDSTIYYQEGFGGPFLLLAYSGTLTEGFTFRGDNNGMGGGFSGDAFDSLITIKNCKFIDLEAGVTGSYSGTIENCIFEHNSWCGACLDIVRSFDMIIKNNTFIDDSIYHLGVYNGKHIITNNLFIGNGAQFMVKINLYNIIGDSALFANNILLNLNNRSIIHYSIGGVGHLRAINNIIIGDLNNPGPDYEGISMGRHPDDSVNLFLSNNLISKYYRGTFIVFNRDTFEVTYSDYWNNTYDFRTYGAAIDTTGIIHAEPMFVDSNDFHLQMFSPLIDAGDPNILDVDGTRSDIGAYGGPYGCSYTYLDLAPAIPESIRVDANSGNAIIRWRYNTEADFNRYKIYRDTITGFAPSWENCIAEVDSSFYIDDEINPNAAYYYRLSAVDNQNNESDYSAEVAVIPNAIDDYSLNALPTYTTIESVYPNPGNAHFTIVYSASNIGAQPPHITLKIFDIQGREIRTLVDGRQETGSYRIVWDGIDDSGEKVASGVYFARVTQWGVPCGDMPIKVTVIK